MIPEDKQGFLDLVVLEKQLQSYDQEEFFLIGSFSAASNVTGVLTDVEATTRLLKKYNALALFDYAAAGPYVKVNVNSPTDCPKDAIFLSPHKFIGGPGTPGILVVKKSILRNMVPSNSGGGTVFFVSEDEHIFTLIHEEREEGGTPDILGSIRAGLAFRVKEDITEEVIFEVEHQFISYINTRWRNHENIVLVGPVTDQKIPTFAFMIRHKGKYLHYNFVAQLLNDLFGIQVRAGCVCAAPYMWELLGIDQYQVKEYQDLLIRGKEVFRPGIVRFNLHYVLQEHEVTYVAKAIEFVAESGWKFLPFYKMNYDTGATVHRAFEKQDTLNRKWISELQYGDQCISDLTQRYWQTSEREFDLNEMLENAEEILQN